MPRRPLYTVEHIERVNRSLRNKLPMLDSIKVAGFSDSSCFYQTVRRLGYEERPRRFRKKRVAFEQDIQPRGFL